MAESVSSVGPAGSVDWYTISPRVARRTARRDLRPSISPMLHGVRQVLSTNCGQALFQLRTCLVRDWLDEKHKMRNKVRVLLRETLIAQNRADEVARAWADVAVE